MTGRPEGKGSVRRFFTFLGQDVAWGLRDVFVNNLAGSVLTPRAVRYVLYRLAGLDVRTPGIFPDCTFVGLGGLHIGEGSFVNRDCYFESIDEISIGRGVAIGMQVLFVTSTHPIDANGRYDPVAKGRPIRVGDNCWLGARATILPGVTIGDGVVVASGAVVTKDCAPGGLYAGVPAKRIRELRPALAVGSLAPPVALDATRSDKGGTPP